VNQVVARFIVTNKEWLSLISVAVALIFLLGFVLAGTTSEQSEAIDFSMTQNELPILTSSKDDLLLDLMANGHWEAELADLPANLDINIQNAHEYMTLVGVSESEQAREALFIMVAPAGWQLQEGMDQINVTPDGRIKGRVGTVIAPHIEILNINSSSVDISVNGERYSKQLYLAQPSAESL